MRKWDPLLSLDLVKRTSGNPWLLAPSIVIVLIVRDTLVQASGQLDQCFYLVGPSSPPNWLGMPLIPTVKAAL